MRDDTKNGCVADYVISRWHDMFVAPIEIKSKCRVSFDVFYRGAIYNTEEKLMRWYPSGVTRTTIRVIGVNFGEIFIQGKEM